MKHFTVIHHGNIPTWADAYDWVQTVVHFIKIHSNKKGLIKIKLFELKSLFKNV